MHAQPSIHSLSAELELILASPQLAPRPSPQAEPPGASPRLCCCHIPTLISLMQRNQCWNMAATKSGASWGLAKMSSSSALSE